MEIESLLVCLRMLMRKCVCENISKDDIQKLFPSEVLPELERLLTLLLQKFQREWRADVHMDKLDHGWYRLTAGILRLLKLEKSLGKEAMNKFSNLGIEGFEKIFSSDKLSQGSKLQSITTLALLAEAVSDSQAKCAALITESSNSESSQRVVDSPSSPPEESLVPYNDDEDDERRALNHIGSREEDGHRVESEEDEDDPYGLG
ncbi:hypothetical protein GOBAR_DD29681 [Gossypium barbadense]|nr:hypothetical protein GOBAR_DD29681 [Gossypium barbadense]